MKKNESRQLQKELSLLYHVAQTVHSLEIDAVLTEIVKIAVEVTHGDSCLIYLLNSEKNELILRASKNPHPELLQKIKLKMGVGITGIVAKEQKPIAIEKNANKDIRFIAFSNLPEDTFEAFLSVPIMNKQNVLGVINIQHRKPHKYSKMEIDLLSASGKLVGGAVFNALLIEESLALRESLEIRKVIERAKGILMKKGTTEDEAYRVIQKESMNSRKSLKEVAEIIIAADKFSLGIDNKRASE